MGRCGRGAGWPCSRSSTVAAAPPIEARTPEGKAAVHALVGQVLTAYGGRENLGKIHA